MSILASLGCPSKPLAPSDRYAYNLAYGEQWEETVASYLRSQGVPASRLCQRFKTAWALKYMRKHPKAWAIPNRPKPYPKGNPKPEDMLRGYQVDLRIKLSHTRQILAEVKALDSSSFDSPSGILIGCVEKYDTKHLPVHLVIAVNTGTEQAYAIAYKPSEWLRWHNQATGETSYRVPKHLMTPLDTWVAAFKDGYLE